MVSAFCGFSDRFGQWLVVGGNPTRERGGIEADNPAVFSLAHAAGFQVRMKIKNSFVD